MSSSSNKLRILGSISAARLLESGLGARAHFPEKRLEIELWNHFDRKYCWCQTERRKPGVQIQSIFKGSFFSWERYVTENSYYQIIGFLGLS